MRRIMVIGCCGAGKSTLARRLHEITKLDLYHLDQYYWKPNWQESETEEWVEKTKELAQKEEWIIDGNYGSSMDIRLERADTVLFLTLPTYKALYRVISRTLKYWGKVRPDMTEGCPERFDMEFLHYVMIFNIKQRPGILKKLNNLPDQTKVHVLKNSSEIDVYLQNLITSNVN